MSPDASVPGQFPTQDGVDRASHVAIIVQLDLDLENLDLLQLDDFAVHAASNELRRMLPQLVNETIDELFPENRLSAVGAQHYQVGPMAGGIADLAHLIVTLAEQSDQLADRLDDVPTYYFFYRIAAALKRRVSDWARNKQLPGFHADFAYTPEDLKLLSEGYTYEILSSVPSGRAVIHCLTKDFYTGYQSPSHPTVSLEYLIVVPTESGSYRFRVMGDSRIVELVVEDDTTERKLDALAYLDGEGDVDE